MSIRGNRHRRRCWFRWGRGPLALVALVLAGCGYRGGYAPPPARDGEPGRTDAAAALPDIAVTPFDNETFRRGLEIRLTRLLADELRARAGRPPARPDESTWLVTGSIVRAEERVLSEDRADEVRESSLEIAVEVTLRARGAEEYLGRRTFSEVAPFSPRAGRIATVEQAREEALRDLAERIVYWLESQQHRLPDRSGKRKERA